MTKALHFRWLRSAGGRRAVAYAVNVVVTLVGVATAHLWLPADAERAKIVLDWASYMLLGSAGALIAGVTITDAVGALRGKPDE